MIGSKSFTQNLIIPNTRDANHSFEVIVQFNKNFSVCDIILPGIPEAPTPPTVKTKETNKAYKEALALYNAQMVGFKARRSRILNLVIGNQASKDLLLYITNCCYVELNQD